MLSLLRRLRRNLVLVHLPKTGGTSARVALMKHERKRQFILDYGPDQKDTSSAFRDILADPVRFGSLGDRLDRERGTFVLGHFRGIKYRRYFALEDFATFLREPYARLLSEYNHHVVRGRIECSFGDFLAMPRFRNTMSRGLDGLDVERFGFLGVTESFERDFPRFLAFVGIGGAVERANSGRYGPEIAALRRDAEFQALARRLNEDDFALYDFVAGRLAGRDLATPSWLEAARAGIRGEAAIAPDGTVHGWVARGQDEPPRRLRLVAEGREIGSTEAAMERDDIRRHFLSEHPDCGFGFAPDLLRGPGVVPSRVWVVDVETGATIPGCPLHVPPLSPPAA
ncbi:sulfotransferase family 2 domain-containing protein [Prosthecomicrobium sp. N25]|uniref:sulfotransferase family 2 domain-containing protein n=1 Tax=Prosthecomicrobium sp. N25 TaxID=3129254 RepID=UPI003078273A